MTYSSVTPNDKKPSKPWSLATLFTLGVGASVFAGILSVASFFIWFPLSLYEAWVAHTLWGWFFVSRGCPDITIFQFVGAMLVLSSMGLYGVRTTATMTTGEKVIIAIGYLARPMFALIFGYLVTLFM